MGPECQLLEFLNSRPALNRRLIRRTIESLFQSLSRHSPGHQHRLRKCLPNSNFLTKWEPRGSLTELKSHHAKCSLALCRARSQTPPHHLSYLIHHQPGEVGIITACMQGRKWKIREVNRLVQGHQLAKGRAQLIPRSLVSQPRAPCTFIEHSGVKLS